MMTLRFAYSVSGVVKFLSHLDVLKMFNRALMRAALPVAYSEGFNPHPKISFGPPRGVGIEGWREYGDITLKEDVPPEEFCRRLNDALPKDLRILDARELELPARALMAVINLTAYQAAFHQDELLLKLLQDEVNRFQQADKVEIVRHHPKKGDKVVDLKAGIRSVALEGNLLLLEIPFTEGGSAKPLEVLQYLVPEGVDYQTARTGLYVLDEAGIAQLP